jgi:hypothetical protein
MQHQQYDDVSNAPFQHGDQYMPSKSKAQNRMMHAVAHDKKLGQRLGVPQKVAKEYVKADAARKIKKLPLHVKKAKKH